jgi:hypothetical protein
MNLKIAKQVKNKEAARGRLRMTEKWSQAETCYFTPVTKRFHTFI